MISSPGSIGVQTRVIVCASNGGNVTETGGNPAIPTPEYLKMCNGQMSPLTNNYLRLNELTKVGCYLPVAEPNKGSAVEC